MNTGDEVIFRETMKAAFREEAYKILTEWSDEKAPGFLETFDSGEILDGLEMELDQKEMTFLEGFDQVDLSLFSLQGLKDIMKRAFREAFEGLMRRDLDALLKEEE